MPFYRPCMPAGSGSLKPWAYRCPKSSRPSSWTKCKSAGLLPKSARMSGSKPGWSTARQSAPVRKALNTLRPTSLKWPFQILRFDCAAALGDVRRRLIFERSISCLFPRPILRLYRHGLLRPDLINIRKKVAKNIAY